MKILTTLNEQDFIITVVKGNTEHSEQSGYFCTCDAFSTSEPSNSSSNVIITVYQQILRHFIPFIFYKS